MTGVSRVFEPGNGLWFGAQQLGDLFLGEPARLAEGSKL